MYKIRVCNLSTVIRYVEWDGVVGNGWLVYNFITIFFSVPLFIFLNDLTYAQRVVRIMCIRKHETYISCERFSFCYVLSHQMQLTSHINKFVVYKKENTLHIRLEWVLEKRWVMKNTSVFLMGRWKYTFI